MNAKQVNKNDEMSAKFGLKSFITICIILYAIVFIVGILTYIIPAGTYEIDENMKAIPGTYHVIESSTRLPFYRWLTAPFEAIVLGNGNITVIEIIVLLLVLGGSFKVLSSTGGFLSIVKILVNKYYKSRYIFICIITLFMMLLSSLFGLQEELLVLFPIFLMFAKGMNWSNIQAARLILITTGVGYTAAIINPFTIGAASKLAGVNVMTGVWYRIIIFVILYIVTCLYLILRAKQDEKKNINNEQEMNKELNEINEDDYKKAKMILIMFFTVLFLIILSSVISFLRDYSLIFMAVPFIIGTVYIGRVLLGSYKAMGKEFFSGMKDIAPAAIIIMIAFSVKYIAEKGNILHTIFNSFYDFFTSMSPYLGVVVLYLVILLIEFFIPSSTAKSLLLIPLLTIMPIPSISVNIILLAYLFGDGYTNVLYPTCGTLVVGISLAKVSYMEWFKKEILFQLLLFVLSIIFLWIAVAIGL